MRTYQGRLFSGLQDFSTVEKLIEYALLDNIRAEMEGLNGEDLIAALDIGPIFYQVLGDENYNPEKAKAKTRKSVVVAQ